MDTILFVDDEKNILNAFVRVFRMEGYNILTAGSGPEGLELVKGNRVALVVSDHRMPGMEGVEFLSKVKEASPDTIRFMLTGYADIKTVMGAINKGEVYRYINKPWNDDELKAAVRDAVDLYRIVQENRALHELTARQNLELAGLNRGLEAKVADKTKRIRDNFFAFVRLFADLMEIYDENVGGHSKRVAAMARGVVLKFGFDAADVDLIESAALLHNIGLIGVPRDIIDKDEDFLNEDEKALLRHNPVLSQDLLRSMDTLRQVGIIIRSHTERYDGTGYPDGLRKDEIHIGSKIIAVCKLYDRLRSGHKMMTQAEAAGCLNAERSKGFDPEVIDVFFDFIKDWKDDGAVQSSPAHGRLAAPATTILPINEIKPGMALVQNIVTSKGRLLVTKGTVLTSALVEKVVNFHRIDPISGGVHILRQSHEIM